MTPVDSISLKSEILKEFNIEGKLSKVFFKSINPEVKCWAGWVDTVIKPTIVVSVDSRSVFSFFVTSVNG